MEDSREVLAKILISARQGHPDWANEIARIVIEANYIHKKDAVNYVEVCVHCWGDFDGRRDGRGFECLNCNGRGIVSKGDIK